jgi:hypothetical protein
MNLTVQIKGFAFENKTLFCFRTHSSISLPRRDDNFEAAAAGHRYSFLLLRYKKNPG